MDAFINAIGFSAGLLVAASLVPQIWRAHKRESAEDLSFFWQATVATGVSLQLIYLHHYDMWAVFYPLFTELAFILYLAGLKLYFEHHLFGVGRGGRDRPFVSRKGAGLSSSDDYSVIGGDDGSGERASLVGSSVAEAGGGEGVGVADGEGSGEETAADDSESQELEGAEKGRPANTGDEEASQTQDL